MSHERRCDCGRILNPSRGWYCECEDDAASNVEVIPRDILNTLLRGLIYSGDQITAEERSKAWAWLEERGRYEEMGQ